MRCRCLLPLLLVAAVVSSTSPKSDPPYKVVCYYGSWAVYRPGQGRFDVEDIDPTICTHLIYTFAGLDPVTHEIISLDPWNDLYDNYGKGAFLRFTGLKQRNPAVKAMLAIGGWNEGSEKYSEMARSAEHRKIFVKSCVDFLHKYHFDGLDVDWEYPAERGGVKEDKANFALLVQELSEAFIPENLLLSAAVAPGKTTIDDAYSLKVIGQYLDIVNVMAYDYYGAWEDCTGHVAPLYTAPEDQGTERASFSVNFTVNYYIQAGIPRHKIAMGIPMYGRGFVLSDPSQHGMYAPTKGGMPACPYTRESGTCGFNEICVMLDEPDWTCTRDEERQAYYCYKSDDWIGFDDPVSVARKGEYIKAMGLGGGMFWSLETDDFHGACGYGIARPLGTTLWGVLNGDTPGPTTHRPAPTTITTRPTQPSPTTRPTQPNPTTTRPTPAPNICQKPGLNPVPDRLCTPDFYECEQMGANWRITELECANGLVFDRELLACTWPLQSAECRH